MESKEVRLLVAALKDLEERYGHGAAEDLRLKLEAVFGNQIANIARELRQIASIQDPHQMRKMLFELIEILEDTKLAIDRDLASTRTYAPADLAKAFFEEEPWTG